MPGNKGHVPSRENAGPNVRSEDSIWTILRSNAGSIAFSTFKAYCLVNFTLFSAEILRSTLDPVYGAIPASQHYGLLTLVALLAACSTYTFWQGPSTRYAQWLPVQALTALTWHFYLFQYSGRLGPTAGPLITSLVTIVPLTLAAGVSAAKQLTHDIEKSFTGRSEKHGAAANITAHLLNAGVCLTAYLEPKIGSVLLADLLRTRILYSRIAVHYLLTLIYALLFPSRYLIFITIPVLSSSLSLSYLQPFHFSDSLVNTILHKHGYSLVARQESTTGYISVLDNVKDGFRVMRCDHSLLGGHWIPPPRYVTIVHEPIYAVFVMLEAVRLVKPESIPEEALDVEEEKNALVIGLGIGTTPSALIHHNISTTILEIDPVVHAFATKYFSLPANHTAIIDDAVHFVSQSQSQSLDKRKQYTYIIHDVFTGGAEPLPLFTQEFLLGLKALLKPGGVVAIVRFPSCFQMLRLPSDPRPISAVV